MALLNMTEGDRILHYGALELLPGLEESVLFCDLLIPDMEESFVSGLDDWWGAFVADMSL